MTAVARRLLGHCPAWQLPAAPGRSRQRSSDGHDFRPARVQAWLAAQGLRRVEATVLAQAERALEAWGGGAAECGLN